MSQDIVYEIRLMRRRHRQQYDELGKFICLDGNAEARIAAYLGRWKNKIERVGTLHYPRVARSRDLVKFTTLEVAINANGELQDVVVRNSSGQKSLDQAAMNIVNMAAPFDPFPEFLRTEYDVLRFAYEWRFTEGYVSSSIKTVGVF